MAQIPQDPNLDSTPALLSEGYAFIPNRCRRYQSDIFATRLMLKKAICIQGAEAAREFYRPNRFTRRGGMPQTTLRLIQDVGSVLVLDGPDHHWRKQMFLSLMGQDSLQRLAEATAAEWRAQVLRWQGRDQVMLFHEAHDILCRAVCAWAGLRISEAEAHQRAREIEVMVDGSGSVGPRNWRGHLLRQRSERWMRDVIRQVRAGTMEVPDGSPAHVVAWHRDRAGKLLDVKVAAVELFNLLRPTVANARFVTFAALALHQYPEWRRTLQTADDQELETFVHEVRRFYPFVPFIGGLVLEAFEWRGYAFTPGTWVLLDIYGTNRDPRSWEDPDSFRPERFRTWGGSPYDFIPQGGGDHHQNHRCPGEWIVIDQLKTIVRLLVGAMQYDVPEQDLEVDLARLLALPRSRFVISNVRAAGEPGR